MCGGGRARGSRSEGTGSPSPLLILMPIGHHPSSPPPAPRSARCSPTWCACPLPPFPILQIAEVLSNLVRVIGEVAAEARKRAPLVAMVSELEEARGELTWVAEWKHDNQRYKVGGRDVKSVQGVPLFLNSPFGDKPFYCSCPAFPSGPLCQPQPAALHPRQQAA